MVISANITGTRTCQPDESTSITNSSTLSKASSVRDLEGGNDTVPDLPVYPCLMVFVNYTEKSHEEVLKDEKEGRLEFTKGPGMLHDTHDTWITQKKEVAKGAYNDTVSLRVELPFVCTSWDITPASIDIQSQCLLLAGSEFSVSGGH